MSQTKIKTNNDQNLNQNSGRGRRGQGPSGSCRSNCCNGRGNNFVANKYVFKGKMKDSPISKLLITKTGHIPIQFKKIVNTLPVLCADKNFWGLDEVIFTGNNLVETNFMQTFPDANLWSITHHVQVSTVNPLDIPLANGSHPACFEMTKQTHVFDVISRRSY